MRLRAASMSAVIVALHVIGWATLVFMVVPEHFSVGDKAFARIEERWAAAGGVD
jgi:hypothetical protein